MTQKIANSIFLHFLFIFGLFKKTLQFLQQINVKNCHDHPEYSTGILTHDLSNTSHLP